MHAALFGLMTTLQTHRQCCLTRTKPRMVHMVPSIVSPPMTMANATVDRRGGGGDRFDFHVIDSVYGTNSDLYQDVLGVEPDASRKEIRASFVDSRDEFFQFQSQVEKGEIVVTDGQLDFSKRRMDAVVAAFRILHDPNLRAFYDEARDKRMQPKKTNDEQKDPVVQAVSRALGEKSSAGPPKRIYATSPTRRSPFESSSGGDTPSSSIIEGRNAKSTPKRSLRKAFSSKRSKATASPTNYYMEDAKPKNRRKHHQEASSLLVSDNESVPGDDIGLSRNYRSERKRGAGATVMTFTSSTIGEDGTSTLPDDRTDATPDDVSVPSYYNDDETLAVDPDLTALCCTSGSSGLKREKTLVSKTRTLLRAVKAELRGSIKDTSMAFDQVCNAFTLQENDIKAVTSKIDKASRQLHG